ncbi:glycine-rich cell wall structural protein 1-like [Panicum miliaceum]|uniref:Glycine-rich cell wall structural protein 1-like n=1 Tax=Panicum miliaceum TaxID=4540 RepID=A0A3L6T393_PANMI|nr:glycine-rich cell wall structural protein 1-like [Panicum miliaceum]
MVAFKLRLRHLCFAAVLSSIAISCCRGQGGGAGAGGAAGGAGGAAGGAVVPGTQDAIQIVAQAALCFDNRQVMNGCLQAMGINVNGGAGGGNGNGSGSGGNSNGNGGGGGNNGGGGGGGGSNGGGGNNNGNGGSTASMCQGPCFGQMMLMMNCVNGILGNIQGYSPGLMQGVQAVFQMSCGNVGNGQQGGGGAGGAGGGGAAGVGGAGGTGGAGAGGTAGGGGAGGGGNTGTASNAVTAGGTTSPNGGSHVAVSNLGEPTSSAGGPTASLTSGFPSVLVTWTCIWLLRLF